ncbi:MAG: inorganic phosphate transporter [bacterium]|nr:inorganic phosphate transporter [bacterium]
MAWAIGANDVANAMGTSVGSGALTLWGAVVVAGVLEFAGAFLVGGHVTKTIRGGILDPTIAAAAPETVIYGMLAALCAAATWLVFATRAGWPVSTTHSIVGAIVGFGAVGLGMDAVEWDRLVPIVASWVLSPLLSGTASFLLFVLIRSTILEHPDPIAQVKRWGPPHIFSLVVVLGLVTLYKGLKNLGLDFELGTAVALSGMLGLVTTLIAYPLVSRVRVDPEADRDFHYATVERMFGIMQIVSACAIAFAHGSNDVANAIGPLAAVLHISSTGTLEAAAPVPTWVLVIGGVGIVAGLSMWGYRVIETVGERITQLTPTRGYAATAAAAATIVLASRLGIPVSTTHVLVGAVLGVGLAGGIAALDFRVVGRIVVSWIVTLPAGAGLAIFFFYFFKGLLLSHGG